MHQEIENIGVVLGRRIIDNITKELGSIHQTQTDIIKFICLSFWPYVFGKQIDKLKPYSKNAFILQDFNFRFLGRISSQYPMGSADEAENFIATEALDRQRTYSYYVKGLVKGALKNLGAGIGGQAIEVQIYDLGSNN